MVIVSGPPSDLFAFFFLKDPNLLIMSNWKLTRLDLQLTLYREIEVNKLIDLYIQFYKLQVKKEEKLGLKAQVYLEKKDSYISVSRKELGSRKNYFKKLLEPEDKYGIRFEVTLKSQKDLSFSESNHLDVAFFFNSKKNLIRHQKPSY
uniref:Uncharacterized protein n=1 Tax=Caulerpa lentillifera TaxID=148947 RepID=A0A345HH04_9CHLO|nr:hypothetical protein [Caulerpa lentillifera]AXG75894.1 hypothetical protein [Caulerpa lentillifera]QKS32300.1 hypothetical protein [Caulerpa lentillifera]QUV75640.1 hypothetical protein [Caulerpa lentillifera]